MRCRVGAEFYYHIQKVLMIGQKLMLKGVVVLSFVFTRKRRDKACNAGAQYLAMNKFHIVDFLAEN